MRECKVAIVGAGYTAREHAKAFADVPGVRLAGICSRTRARAEALASELAIPVVADSIDELRRTTEADLVVVTVTELSMNAVAKACFAHPWTVFLEKPPGYHLDDALDIAAAAKKAGRRVHVALNRASMSSTRLVLDALAKDGGARFVKVQDQQSMARARAGGQPEEVVANYMFANSIHLVDYFRLFARGRATRVERVIDTGAKRHPPELGVLVAKVEFDSGDVGLYESIWDGPGPWAASVWVPGARWEIRPLEQVVAQRLGEPAKPLAIDPIDTAFKPGFRRQAELAARAATGGDAEALPTLDDALVTMRLIGNIFRSSA